MQAARGCGCSIRHSVHATGGSLLLHALLDLWLNGIQTHVLPAILNLDVRKRQAVLEGSGHLNKMLSVYCTLIDHGPQSPCILTFETCALLKTLFATSSGRSGWNVAAMADQTFS